MRKTTIATILGALLLVSTAQAVPIPAVTFDDTSSSTFVSVSETVGWKFNVTAPILVGALGVFDSDLNGLLGGHDVGIWNNANNSLITSATVQAGTVNPLLNQFRYAQIAPILLGVGSYTIGATWGTGATSDDYIANTTNFQTMSAITFQGAEYIEAASLTRPTTDADFFSNGMFGPNFQVVPEPGTLVLVGAGLFAMAVCSKRLRQSNAI